VRTNDQEGNAAARTGTESFSEFFWETKQHVDYYMCWEVAEKAKMIID